MCLVILEDIIKVLNKNENIVFSFLFILNILEKLVINSKQKWNY